MWRQSDTVDIWQYSTPNITIHALTSLYSWLEAAIGGKEQKYKRLAFFLSETVFLFLFFFFCTKQPIPSTGKQQSRKQNNFQHQTPLDTTKQHKQTLPPLFLTTATMGRKDGYDFPKPPPSPPPPQPAPPPEEE
jgi:hypothetical protein